jgi:hypothetical protein
MSKDKIVKKINKTPRQKLMSNKTTSKIPQTPKEKKMWIAARKIATKESGAQSEKSVPWTLVTTIFKKAKIANKVPKKEDVKNAKFSKKVSRYKK